MRYFFKSDYFDLIHPTASPRQNKYWNKTNLELAVENTKKIRIDDDILNKAKEYSDGEIPNKQIGSIILFPEIDENRLKVMKSFINSIFGLVIDELKKEYNDKSDPVGFYGISDDGKYFDGTTVNGLSNEKFGKNSIGIYLAGITDTTADYIVEEAIDRCYKSSDKNDRKADDEHKIGFSSFNTFLIYNGERKKFYQFGSHEKQLYSRPKMSKPGYDATIYDNPFNISERGAYSNGIDAD